MTCVNHATTDFTHPKTIKRQGLLPMSRFFQCTHRLNFCLEQGIYLSWNPQSRDFNSDVFLLQHNEFSSHKETQNMGEFDHIYHITRHFGVGDYPKSPINYYGKLPEKWKETIILEKTPMFHWTMMMGGRVSFCLFLLIAHCTWPGYVIFTWWFILLFGEKLWISGSHCFFKEVQWKETNIRLNVGLMYTTCTFCKAPNLRQTRGRYRVPPLKMSNHQDSPRWIFNANKKSMLGTSEKAYHTYLRTSSILVMW